LVDQAVDAVLMAGVRTADLARPGDPVLGTREVGEEVARLVLWGRAVEPVIDR
jgi:3-isopropylmalate dehydrogenase